MFSQGGAPNSGPVRTGQTNHVIVSVSDDMIYEIAMAPIWQCKQLRLPFI